VVKSIVDNQSYKMENIQIGTMEFMGRKLRMKEMSVLNDVISGIGNVDEILLIESLKISSFKFEGGYSAVWLDGEPLVSEPPVWETREEAILAKAKKGEGYFGLEEWEVMWSEYENENKLPEKVGGVSIEKAARLLIVKTDIMRDLKEMRGEAEQRVEASMRTIEERVGFDRTFTFSTFQEYVCAKRMLAWLDNMDENFFGDDGFYLESFLKGVMYCIRVRMNTRYSEKATDVMESSVNDIILKILIRKLFGWSVKYKEDSGYDMADIKSLYQILGI